MYKFFLLLILLFPLDMFSQISEDFSDGDFISNPVWSGSDSQFKVNSFLQLQLNSLTADTSYLCTPNSFFGETEWRFLVKLAFNPSSNNLARVYLNSTGSNLKTSSNAYFVELGNTADNVCLYRQDGVALTKIINGGVASLNASNNTINVKVTRSSNGNWTLYTDATGGNNFVTEGNCTDNTYSTSAFFGVFCKYTVSNSTKFYFDDIYVGPIQIDTVAPKLSSANILSNSVIELNFNEALDSVNANNSINYAINPVISVLDSARLELGNKSKVLLYFQTPFPNGTNITIQCTHISDLNGNIAGSQTVSLSYYTPKLYDIVINEIFADPDPAVALPNAEFIELKNNTNFEINLANWKFQYGTTQKTIISGKIAANGYILLCYQNDTAFFSGFGNYVPLSGLSLTNTGMQLILLDAKGNLMHEVYYQDTWYSDNNKKNGGWSLEMIDSKNPCGCETNYRASVHISGGTPGFANSILASNPDIKDPEILRVILPDSVTLKVLFSESMDSIKIKNQLAYFVNGNIGNPNSVKLVFPDYKSVILTFANAFQPGTIYSLEIQDSLLDCVGNDLNILTKFDFSLPALPSKGEIVINEILFNPKDDGVDFVELYNNSNKVFDLKNMRLSNWNGTLSIPENVTEISNEGFLVFPHTYTVISTKPEKVRSQYVTGEAKYFCSVSSMPSMNNESGTIALILSNLEMLDYFEYFQEMHFSLLQSTEGVSLERIRPTVTSQDKNNWHSASQNCGFATPALRNSQSLTTPEPKGEISVIPEVFSPDNDGYQDVVSIRYDFDNAGNTANVVIFNASGQSVKQLIRNELVSTSGIWVWDGLNEKGEKLPYGIYIIYIEVFDLQGDINRFKNTVILGGKL